VHAVVDFRQAPSLADLASSVLKAAGASSSSSSSSSVQDPNGIASALQPSIGGQLLYFNIE
jgi:hypothetical protein